MTVVINDARQPRPRQIWFESIEIGDVFEYDQSIWIKITDDEAILLATDDVKCFDAKGWCIQVDVEITVTRNTPQSV